MELGSLIFMTGEEKKLVFLFPRVEAADVWFQSLNLLQKIMIKKELQQKEPFKM